MFDSFLPVEQEQAFSEVVWSNLSTLTLYWSCFLISPPCPPCSSWGSLLQSWTWVPHAGCCEGGKHWQSSPGHFTGLATQSSLDWKSFPVEYLLTRCSVPGQTLEWLHSTVTDTGTRREGARRKSWPGLPGTAQGMQWGSSPPPQGRSWPRPSKRLLMSRERGWTWQ